MSRLQTLIGDYNKFLSTVLENVKAVGIDISMYEIDHLAYRCPTHSCYKDMKEKMKNFGELLGENIISDRPIAIFRLSKPIKYQDYKIPFFELLAPKKIHKHINGLQHIEVVVDSGIKKLIESYPQINFDCEDIGREINPETEIEFADGTEIKFHNMPINEAQRKQKESGKL